jgi:hypothetical protein
MNYIQIKEDDKQGTLSLNPEDEESFHMQTVTQKKLKGTIPVIDSTA